METRYTIDEALRIFGVGKFQRKLIMVLGIVLLSQSVQFGGISLLLGSIQCEFGEQPSNTPLLDVALLVGAIVGTVLQGILSDKLGRKRMLALFLPVVAYLDLLFAISPTYQWASTLRSFIGVFICSTGTFFAIEYFPTVARADVAIIRIYWCIGNIFVTALAYYFSDRWKWRTSMVIISLLPACACVFLMLIPESPRYLLTIGLRSEASEILQLMAHQNDIYFPHNYIKLKSYRKCTTSDVFNLLDKKFYCVTLTVCYLIGAMSLLRKGTAVLTQSIFIARYTDSSRLISFSCSACSPMGIKTLLWLVLLSTVDLFGIMASYCGTAISGRKRGYVIMETICLFGLFSLLLVDTNLSLISILISNFGLSGALSCLVQFVTEIYPTCIRGTAVGIVATFYLCGNVLSSYMSNIIVDLDLIAIVVFYLAVGGTCIALTTLLDEETQYRDLEDVIESDTIHASR